MPRAGSKSAEGGAPKPNQTKAPSFSVWFKDGRVHGESLVFGCGTREGEVGWRGPHGRLCFGMCESTWSECSEHQGLGGQAKTSGRHIRSGIASCCLSAITWTRPCCAFSPPHPHTLTRLVRFSAPSQVGEKQLMTVLEPDCLHTVGLLRDKQMWEKRLIKHSTRVNYTIPKWVPAPGHWRAAL